MGEETSTITYEALYNLVRNEKTNDAIQEIHPDTYKQIVKYLTTKIRIYKKAKKNGNDNEIERIKTQITSARKLIKDFYERRERKILQLAINKSRTKSDLVDDSALLEDEKMLFEEGTNILDKYRKNILLNLVNAKLPFGEEMDIGKEEDTTIMIRFIGPVPKFLGLNKEIYGPFEKGDVANLPKEISEVLIKRDRAEKMNI